MVKKLHPRSTRRCPWRLCSGGTLDSGGTRYSTIPFTLFFRGKSSNGFSAPNSEQLVQSPTSSHVLNEKKLRETNSWVFLCVSSLHLRCNPFSLPASALSALWNLSLQNAFPSPTGYKQRRCHLPWAGQRSLQLVSKGRGSPSAS